MVLARRRAFYRTRDQGIVPKHQVLNNKTPAAYRKKISATHMNFQPVPPDDHRCNLAEKEIHTWKDNFIGVMSGTVATFPVHLWCQAIPQAEWQLFLLRKSNVNPKVSAYAHIYGPHDYKAATFLPIGMETLVHDNPKRRGNFAENFSKWYVLGTASEHYRSWKMWMKDTRATRILATVFHKHKYITKTGVTPEDHIISTAHKLTAELKGRTDNQLIQKSLQQLEWLGTIIKQVWIQKDNKQRIPPIETPI